MRCTLAVTMLLSLAAPVGAATLATDGRAVATIVIGREPTIAEQAAGRELADYLGKVTGGAFATVAEADAPAQGSRIFLGQTRFAADQGIDFAALGPEEWIVRTVNSDVLIAGGRPRGTLYAVYRFLEDVVGVRW